MSLKDILDLFAAIVTLAMVGVIIQSEQTAAIISAWTSGFAQSIRAATGR